MASNPPFFVEDQTDEDFFDKLVNDDDDFQTPSTSAPLQGFADGSDSDDIKIFANLRVGDVITRFEDTGRQSGRAETKQEDAQELLAKSDVKPLLAEEPRVQKKTGSLVSFDSSGFDGFLESNDGSIGAEVDSSASKNSGSTNLGAKEVQWSAFNTDLTQNGNNGFGSYSDIFGELGDGNVNTENNWTYGSEVSSGMETRATLDLGNSYKYGQHQDGISYDAGKEQLSYEQDLNSSQYWDSLYPGWKYDPNTGQWYQLDGYDAASSVQGGANSNLASDWSVSDVKPEVSYYQQSSESVVGTVEHTLMTEGVNNLKQVSEMCGTSGGVSNWSSMPHENNYPSHMVFDPQYPGWYYDTIAQEWCSLESYASSAYLAAQVQNKQAKSDFSSRTLSHETDPKIYNEFANATNYVSESFASQSQDYNLGVSFGNNKQPGSNAWQPETQSQPDVVSKPLGSQRLENPFLLNKNVGQLNSYSYEQENQGHNYLSASTGAQGFSSVNFNQQFNQPRTEQMEHMNVSDDYYVNQNSVNFSQQAFQSAQQFSYAATSGRSSAGRPPHALVTFGFGGKLIVMKGNNNFNSSSYANQDAGTAISVLNLTEVVTGNGDASSIEGSVKEYFWTLCRQSFPGPLAGGNVGMKELNKWIDERIAQCEAPYVDYNKGKLLRLLLSLLKIACQHYGKLRSPFSADGTSKEIDEAETAVARLFASAGRNGLQFSEYDALAHCLHKLPSEAQMRATAAEVQGLLVSGRKKEALYRAQEGQLWGPALVLATQLGDQFYIDTVKQMALRQLVAGSPLRTLCLLIAGQPAEVFSADNSAVNSISSSANMSQQTGQLSANGMLDDWEENLAVIASNRTKDDDLVLIHLGDCLWKERSKIVAAHICYLVAEANFEPFSDSARFCLVGADHWKFPRTYASPEAIQRTEVYEYSKVLGNSQFVLLAFQPYRLVYAHMLAEVGRVSDSLKYCQAVFKSLKTGRSPEVETWRQLASSLEERIRTHQQGGFSTNLAPAKLMGKLLNLFDSTTHLVVGGLPPPVPASSVGNVQGNELYQLSSGLRVSSSQSTMAMSSLIPSTSVEPISERMADGSKMTMYSRSVSEPDFGRSPRQKQADSSKEVTSVDAQVKASGGTSRFGRFGFGSQLFQKTVGLVLKPRKDRQAKLGETNKFYYDEKLKRWVEEGVEPPPEEAALPPPPTSGSFQNGMADYNLNNALESEGSFSNGVPEIKSPFPVEHGSGIPPIPFPVEHGSGIPPIPLTSNQFSARGRMGVRSRYVDTFNKGGASPTNLFQSPSVLTAKTSVGSNPKFFVPTLASSVEQPVDSVADSTVEENHSTSIGGESYNSLAPSSAMSMQRFASMDNIPNNETGMKYNGSVSSLSRRTASWSGSFTNASTPSSRPEAKPLEEVLGMPPLSIMGNDSSLTRPSVDVSFRDELQEVEL